jgi:hypothetical protein
MTYPAYDTSGASGSLETRSGPVTCASCGCRLQHAADGSAWFHFAPIGGRDARGCRVDCADAAHDSSGRTVSAAG